MYKMGYNRQKKEIKFTIFAKDIKVSEGHKDHHSGTGAHNNKPRKNRTRRDENRNAIRESKDGH